MKRILPTVVVLAVLAMLCCLLPGCVATSGGRTDTVQPPPDLPKIQAAKAYLDSTITRIKVDVAKVKAELPARVAAIEATVGPTVTTAVGALAGMGV